MESNKYDKAIKKNYFDDFTEEDIKKQNRNKQLTFDHPCRIFIIGYSGSGKASKLLNLISRQPDLEKFFIYPIDPCEPKYQLLISKRKSVGLKNVIILKVLLNILMI